MKFYSRLIALGTAAFALTACNQNQTALCAQRPSDARIAMAIKSAIGNRPGGVGVLGVQRGDTCDQYAVVFTSDIREVQMFGPARPISGVAQLIHTDNGQWFILEGVAAPQEVE